MQFLALTRRRSETFTDAQFAEFADVEAARARELYAQGRVRSIYTRGDRPGAAIVLEAADAEEAAALAASLPFAQRGMLEIQIIPLLPYRGFAL